MTVRRYYNAHLHIRTILFMDLWILNIIYLYLFKIKNKLDTLLMKALHSSTNQRWKFIWYMDFFRKLVRFDSLAPLCRTSISKGSSITEATMPIFPPLRVIVSFRRDRKPFTWVTEPGTTCYSLSLSLPLSRWLENIFQHRGIRRFILRTSYGSEVGNATDGTPTRDRKRGEWTLSYILSLLDNLMWFIVEAKLTVFFFFFFTFVGVY